MDNVNNCTRKALIIGINKYKKFNNLTTCINDANGIANLLSYNFDGSKNFKVNKLLNGQATRCNIRKNIRSLFSGNSDIALLYFSGHGHDDDENDGFLVSYDGVEDDWGIPMPEILKYVIKSKCKNKIIILDCCYAGHAGQVGLIGDQSIMTEGTVILTSSRKNETSIAYEGCKYSLFTSLFINGLNGAASDIFGRTTPSAIYSFIDNALGPGEQRPVFKSNVESFISLRQCEKIIEESILVYMPKIFNHSYIKRLNPSYEPTNIKGGVHKNYSPYAKEKNVEIFKILLQYYKAGLVTPIEEENMYETAMNSNRCKLTNAGIYYYNMVKSGKL